MSNSDKDFASIRHAEMAFDSADDLGAGEAWLFNPTTEEQRTGNR